MDDNVIKMIVLASLLLAAIGLVVFGVRHAKKLERERREALARLAQRLRLAFAPEGSAALLAELDQLIGTRHKHSARVRNLLSGKRDGIPFELADYSFVTGGGKHSHHHQHSVVVVRPGFPVPDFHLRHENWLDKIGDYVGWHDLDFDHRPEFSRRYFLRGKDETAIRALFSDRALGLLEREERQDLILGGHGDALMIHSGNKFVKPDELEGYLDWAIRVAGYFSRR